MIPIHPHQRVVRSFIVVTRVEQYLPWTMIYITTYTVKMLLNIVLSHDEYFLLILVLYLSHARYWSWPGLKGPVYAFTLVFQKFSRQKFLKKYFTEYNLHNLGKQYSEGKHGVWGSHPFVLASRLLAIHLPGPKRPQECSLGLTPGFDELGRDNCKTRRERFKCYDLMCLILEV